MKTNLIITAVGSAVYGLYRTYRQAKLDKGLDQLLAGGTVVLDVRTPEKFTAGHIDGSLNIPRSRLRNEQLRLDKDQVYITCCSHGLRSVKAVDVLATGGWFPARL